YAGTPYRYWMEHEFHEDFGLETMLNPRTTNAMYDAVAQMLARPEYRPRHLFDQFKIAALTTTHDPVNDVAPHNPRAPEPASTPPSARTSTSSRPARTSASSPTRSARPPGSTPAPMTATSRRCASAACTSATTAPSPPTTRTSIPAPSG